MPLLARPLAFAALLALAVTLQSATAAAQQTCKFASSGEGMTLTLVLQGAPGLSLRVDWGDGNVSSVRRLDELRERGYIRHAYVVPGQYKVRVDARDPDGAGCLLELGIEVPYEGSDDPETTEMLPPPGAPPDEPDTEVVRAEDIGAPIQPALATSAPRQTQPSEPPGPGPLARLVDAIGRAVGAIGRLLWGSR